VDHLLEFPKSLPEKIKTKIEKNKEQLLLSRKLIALKEDVPISLEWEDCSVRLNEQEKFLPLLEKLGFQKIVKELYAKGVLETSQEDVEKFPGNIKRF